LVADTFCVLTSVITSIPALHKSLRLLISSTTWLRIRPCLISVSHNLRPREAQQCLCHVIGLWNMWPKDWWNRSLVSWQWRSEISENSCWFTCAYCNCNYDCFNFR